MKATSELRVKGANCSETKSHSCGKIMNYDVTKRKITIKIANFGKFIHNHIDSGHIISILTGVYTYLKTGSFRRGIQAGTREYEHIL